HHDFGGNASALLAGFVRRIDRLKAEMIGPEAYAEWAARLGDEAFSAREREFAEVYRAHERMLRDARAGDACDLVLRALRSPEPRFAHLLADDAQELDFVGWSLALSVGGRGLTVAANPDVTLRRFRGAGAARIAAFAAGSPVLELGESW